MGAVKCRVPPPRKCSASAFEIICHIFGGRRTLPLHEILWILYNVLCTWSTHPRLHVSPLIHTALWWPLAAQTANTGQGYVTLDTSTRHSHLTTPRSAPWGNASGPPRPVPSGWCFGTRVFEYLNVSELDRGATSPSAVDISLQGGGDSTMSSKLF